MNSEGRILGAGRCSGAYHISDGIAVAMAAIKGAVEKACEQAKVPLDDMEAVGAGVTGMDWPEDYRLLRPSIQQVTGVQNIYLFNDAIGAFYSGATGDSGAVLCAGTGLNVAVRSPKSEEFVLGFYIDEQDQGGGALAQRAIMRVFQAEIGLERPTELSGLFLRAAGVQNVDDLLHRFVVDENFSRSIKDMVPDIVDCAENGDAVTIELLNDFASDISRYLRAGLQRFDMLNTETDIVLSGSVLKGPKNRLRDDVAHDVHIFAPKAHIINARYEPVVGAGFAALKNCVNIVSREAIWNNISESAHQFGLERSHSCSRI